MYRRNSGFTVIELMFTVGILAILASLAVPNLSYFLLKQRVSSKASELQNSLAFARAEATKRNVNIVVIPASNSTDGWATGWCVGTDDIANCNAANVLKRYQASQGDILLNSNYLQSTNRLTFRRDGTLLAGLNDDTFKISSSRLENTDNSARCVSLNPLGKASLKKVNRDDDC